MSRPFVTIIVPIRNEEHGIVACLASLRKQDYPANRLEILVIDGESTDRSVKLVRKVMAEDSRVVLLSNPKKIQSAALNLGIRRARGSIIVRADAHADYGKTYVSTCVEHLEAGRAENVGGMQRGIGTTHFNSAVAVALNSVIGSGNAAYRRATGQRYAETVWLGAWHRHTLVGLGGFNEHLVANEDYELNWRLRKLHGRILLDPSLPCHYHPRGSFSGLYRQYFRYGTGKSQMLQTYPDSLIARQLAAPLLVFGLAATALLLHFIHWPFLLLSGLYLALILIGSIRTGITGGWRHLPYLPGIFIVMHLAWGAGFFWGMARYGGINLHLKSLPSMKQPVLQTNLTAKRAIT